MATNTPTTLGSAVIDRDCPDFAEFCRLFAPEVGVSADVAEFLIEKVIVTRLDRGMISTILAPLADHPEDATVSWNNLPQNPDGSMVARDVRVHRTVVGDQAYYSATGLRCADCCQFDRLFSEDDYPMPARMDALQELHSRALRCGRCFVCGLESPPPVITLHHSPAKFARQVATIKKTHNEMSLAEDRLCQAIAGVRAMLTEAPVDQTSVLERKCVRLGNQPTDARIDLEVHFRNAAEVVIFATFNGKKFPRWARHTLVYSFCRSVATRLMGASLPPPDKLVFVLRAWPLGQDTPKLEITYTPADMKRLDDAQRAWAATGFAATAHHIPAPKYEQDPGTGMFTMDIDLAGPNPVWTTCTCGNKDGLKYCPCGIARYCCRECQVKDRKNHRAFCNDRIAELKAKADADTDADDPKGKAPA